ncbi:MAG TPA: hypothetical protein VEX38_08410 [Fimbriimonadaceae bacterium]|nr:hypothetical protein [Fimbriimonadaceae bacterium]
MLSALAALATAPAVFTFNGGTSASLSSSLSEHLNEPVVIVAPAEHKFKALVVTYEKREDLRNLLANHLQLEKGAGDAWGLSLKWWPEEVLLRNIGIIGGPPPATYDPPKIESGADGWTIRCFGPLPLSELAKKPFAKRLAYHWFFDRAPIAVTATKASEESLVKALQAALGSGDPLAADQYYLALDPMIHKRRSMVTLERAAKDSPSALFRDNNMVALAALADLTLEQIKQLFEKPENTVVLNVKADTPLHAAVSRKIQTVLSLEGPGAAEAVNMLKSRIDPSAPVDVELMAKGQAAVVVRDKEGTPIRF